MWFKLGCSVAALSVAVVASAQESRPIAEIQFTGRQKTNETVATLAVNKVFKIGSPFAFKGLEDAKKALLDTGLYATVTARFEELPDRRIRLIFNLAENPVIDVITFTGNKVIKNDELLKLMATKPGEVLNQKTLSSDVLKIPRFYQSQGYRALVVIDEVSLDPKTRTLTIPILETVVESIEVTGNIKTARSVVTRELRTKVGNPYNESLLQEDLSRLMRLNIFVDAVTNAEPGSDLDKTKVTLAVQEQRTGQVGVSVGYSARQRLIGTVSLNEQNFRGKGQGLDLQWSVAGGISRNSYELGFTEPWVDKNNTSASINLYDRLAFRFNRILSSNLTNDTSNNQYYEERKGAGFNLSRPLTADRFTRAFAGLRAEGIQANNLQQNYDALSDDDIRNLRGSLVQDGRISAVTFGVISNPTDNAQDPTRGYYLSPSIEFGHSRFNYQKPSLNPKFGQTGEPRLLLEDRSQNGGFVKYILDARRYTSLNGERSKENLREGKRVLASRLMVGTATGNIAFSEQFFMGGADNLRGFFDDRFWGNNMFLFSNEVRIPLDKTNQLGGVFFVDVGHAWGASTVNQENIAGFQQQTGFHPRTSFGVGIRVRTPVGPVRLDYGFGDGAGRSHFSIGQAF
ncbi:BamA/OMP85 family outer membrane protein [Armatimonas rosea]|uniref:Outer membrane protein insertion porin family n=1 Tax=Armatimonas rosea TaxID=685828 RepID=A0A7W9W6W4_ARMRO|nr:BamA/TamA family outer membrane protein [Armatimonas rosea]MBB6051889.1 outer membrane protein insertion porin family [Armatimonas rosea]